MTSFACLREAIREVKEAIEELKQNAILLECKCSMGYILHSVCDLFCDFAERFLAFYCSEYSCSFNKIRVVPFVTATPGENPLKQNPNIRVRPFVHHKAIILLFDDDSWILLSLPPDKETRGVCIYGVGNQQLDDCWKAKANARCEAEEFIVALMHYLLKGFRCDYHSKGKWNKHEWWVIEFDDESKLVCSEFGVSSPIVANPLATAMRKADVANILFGNIHFLKRICKACSMH